MILATRDLRVSVAGRLFRLPGRAMSGRAIFGRKPFIPFPSEKVNENRGGSMLRNTVYALAAVLSWYFAYEYLVNRIDTDCSLIRQTMFNLKKSPKVTEALQDNSIKVKYGTIQGEMHMIRGVADVTFIAENSSETKSVLVHVKAKRGGGSWSTTRLEITPLDPPGPNSPIIILSIDD
jgi:hypothetical protein